VSLTRIALLSFFTIAVFESSVKVILEKLESLSEDNRDLKNKIRLLQAQGSINTDAAIVFKYPPLPLKDEEELKKTEENIVDPIQFQQLVRPKQNNKHTDNTVLENMPTFIHIRIPMASFN